MIATSCAAEPAIATPCVRVCTMDIGGFCIGCGRTLTEIGSWTALSPSARTAVMEKLAARKAAVRRETPL